MLNTTDTKQQDERRTNRTLLGGLVSLLLCIGLLWQFSGLLFAQQRAASDNKPTNEPVQETTVQGTSEQSSDQTDTSVADGSSTTLYLPLLANDHDAQLVDRLGFGTSVSSIDVYPEIRSLKAGWYVDWYVNRGADRPSGIEYMPMVRMHQDISCGSYVMPDRAACPYVEPHSYTYTPEASVITTMARNNPGLTWLLGNEMDRLDWEGGGQDEMLPELYAVAYKELYDIIKAADPTAKIAIGGIIQATPMRLAYLTKAWDEYQRLYGVDMPVDIWNVHAFVVGELCYWEREDGDRKLVCAGAGVPPGETEKEGAYIGESWKHIDQVTFDEQIRAFRGWMKDRGQQNKPLIVTEYGVLYDTNPCINQACPDPDAYNLQDPDVVHNFMLWTFDYFMNTKDCDLGYAADDCRLVQRWAWFSLEDVEWDFNPHTVLFDRETKQITPAGEKYRDWAINSLSIQQ